MSGVLQSPWRVSEPAGRLDRRISLLYPSETRDAAGGVPVTWISAGNVWASRNVMEGSEAQEADQKISLGMLGFRIRYGKPVTAKWRVFFEGIVYEIIAPPMEIGRQQFTDLVCRALNPGDVVMSGVGFQAFIIDLDEGDELVDVEFESPFETVPEGTTVTLLVPGESAGFTTVIDDETRTTDGFRVLFGATVPGPGYRLSVVAAQ